MSAQASPQAAAARPAGPAVAAAEEGRPRRRSVMTVPGAAACTAQLDSFAVDVALAGIGRSFPRVSTVGVWWVLPPSHPNAPPRAAPCAT
ncbi:hypothetical protein ACIP98_31690 [Streptomyces sp. NPDC088354]|uniref:hypothetical protein n=1 Tax=Streptomyces sp. NPDC088354 TaxID=3365856 RepID=UPI003829332A